MNATGPRPDLLELLISDVLARWPEAASALRRAGMGACLGCAMAPFETVREAAKELQLDIKKVEQVLSRACNGGRL